MLDQIKQIIEQVSSQEANSKGIPANLSGAVAQETGASIVGGIKDAISNGNLGQITDLFQGSGNVASNGAVMAIVTNLVTSLSGKLGIDANLAQGFAGSVVPKVLETLIGKAKNSGESGFQVTDLLSSLSGGSAGAGGLLESLGGSLGLDKNKDGKIGLDDAMSAIKGLF